MNCDSKDLLQPIGPLPDGRLLVSRHRPDHSTEVGSVCPTQAGKPTVPGQEIVTTQWRADGSYEIVDSYVYGAGARSGPAQVATAGYRSGWDRTFNARGGDA